MSTALAWVGLITCSVVITQVTILALRTRPNGRIHPDRPTYLLLGYTAILGAVWFTLLLLGAPSPTPSWKDASRVFMFSPYISIAVVLGIRLRQPGLPTRIDKKIGD